MSKVYGKGVSNYTLCRKPACLHYLVQHPWRIHSLFWACADDYKSQYDGVTKTASLGTGQNVTLKNLLDYATNGMEQLSQCFGLYIHPS